MVGCSSFGDPGPDQNSGRLRGAISRQAAVARAETTTADSPTRTLAPIPVEEVPDVVMEEAKMKVSGIEAALAALASVGTTNGPEVQVLQDAEGHTSSPRKSHFCPDRPVRGPRRVAGRVAELEAGQACVTRLRAAAEQSSVPPGDVDEIVSLRAKLASAEEEGRSFASEQSKKFATGCGANAMPGQDLPPMPKTRIPHDLFHECWN